LLTAYKPHDVRSSLLRADDDDVSLDIYPIIDTSFAYRHGEWNAFSPVPCCHSDDVLDIKDGGIMVLGPYVCA